MASGGFAGGLAQGITNGMQMMNMRDQVNLQKQNADRQAKNDERDAELHGAKMDDLNFNKKQRDGLQKSNDIIAAEYARRLTGQQNQTGVASTPAPGLNMVASAAPAASGTAAPGLSDTSRPAMPNMPSDQFIQKHMLTGNLAEDPEMLSFMAKTYAENGHADKMLPYLNQMYEAKKRGFADALPHLLSNNGAGAAEALRRAGIPIEGDLTLVDPKTMTWKGKVNGVEQEFNTRAVFGAANPSEYFKMQLEQPEREAKIDALKANSEKDRSMAKAYAAGSLGAGRGGAGAAGPKVQRTVETDQGLVAIMSDGTKRIIADDKGMPLFGTSGQKIAAGLVGKTLDPLSETADIASRVNQMTGQLRGGKPPPPARLNDLPDGAKHIGTSDGKPVYELPNGKRFISE